MKTLPVIATLMSASACATLPPVTSTSIREGCEERLKYRWLTHDAEDFDALAVKAEANAERYQIRLSATTEAQELAGGGGERHAFAVATKIVRLNAQAADYRVRAAARRSQAEEYSRACVDAGGY